MTNPQTGKWQHYKGGIYQVIRTAKWHPFDVMRAYAYDQPFRLEENPEIEIFLHSDGYHADLIKHDQDYGERVFYVGHTGRWARRIESFLGVTASGESRFRYLEGEL
ncbi:MAG TPA: hypothetical protein V6D19_18750 [Stenomitos sp.]